MRGIVGIRGSLSGMLAAALVLTSGSAFAADPPAAKAPAKAKATTSKARAKAASVDEVAILETSKGRMVVEFYDKDAPKTVKNFKSLARKGYYNGTGFHRIMKDFMIQGGDPKSKNPKAPDLGTGGPGYTIPDEFNAHKHVKGVLSMAHTAEPNSGGSQFFIMRTTYPSLDNKYTVFGKVIDGIPVLDAIASVPVGPNPMMAGEQSKPLEWVTVKSVKIVPRATALGGTKTTAATGAGTPAAAAATPGTKTTPPAKAEATPAKRPESAASASTTATPPAAHDHSAHGHSAPADSTAKK